MKRIILVLLFIAPAIISISAQADANGYEDGAWVLKGVTGVNLSQSSLSNWSAGGESSIAGNVYLNGSLLRKSGKWLWQTTLALEYGLSQNDTDGVRKTNDNINLATQLGYSVDDKWFYTAMGDIKTQFYKGYKYPDRENYISNLFAPAYSNVSLGMEYRPKANYSFYLSPVAGKFTFVYDDFLSDKGSFGLDPGDNFKAELGAYFKSRIEQALMENINLVSTVDFFTPYESSFGNVDANWDVMISMKVNKYISATINTTLKYDNDVKTTNDAGDKRGAKVQFKEVLGVGIAYRF